MRRHEGVTQQQKQNQSIMMLLLSVHKASKSCSRLVDGDFAGSSVPQQPYTVAQQ